MGAVYEAEQEDPHRLVALKVVRGGTFVDEHVARLFRREAQALALLNHPHIAAIYDAGHTDEGEHYFVMERVYGVPLDRYIRETSPSLHDGLALFAQICEAIAYAHQRGIIHRDLKPGNILIAAEGAEGSRTQGSKRREPSASSQGLGLKSQASPKLLDFGLAKITESDVSVSTMTAGLQRIEGTLAYMSPEQAEMSRLDIDTRTDIYSLGVLLYELLTGTLPFDAKSLRSAAYAEMQRIIREVDPQKPSTRLSSLTVSESKGPQLHGAVASGGPRAVTLDASAPEPQRLYAEVLEASSSSPARSLVAAIAACRQSNPRTLVKSIRGDLDWIVMKCLAKDRTGRYETANGLAMEIRRYLQHEPVLAGPPGASYRVRKFVGRNRVAVALACSALIAAFSCAAWLFERLDKQASLATALSEELIRTLKASEFQPAQELARKVLVADPKSFAGHCNAANVKIAEYRKAGDFSRAREAFDHLDEAIAIAPHRAEPYNIRAILLREQGRQEEALAALEKAIAIDPNYYPSHVTLANTLVRFHRWQEAEQSLRRAAALPAQAQDNRPWLRWHNLASIQWALGKPEAREALNKALAEKGAEAVPQVRLLEARILLASGSDADRSRALRAAIVTDDQARDSVPPRGLCRRLLALAHLRSGDDEKALADAHQAIASGDVYPAYDHLIAAIALARLGRTKDAAASLKAAEAAWPKHLENSPGGLITSPELMQNGILWLEQAAELRRLREEAQAFTHAERG